MIAPFLIHYGIKYRYLKIPFSIVFDQDVNEIEFLIGNKIATYFD